MKKQFTISNRPTNLPRRQMPGLPTGSGAVALLLGLGLCFSCASGFLFLKEITVAGALLLFPLAVRRMTGTNA